MPFWVVGGHVGFNRVGRGSTCSSCSAVNRKGVAQELRYGPARRDAKVGVHPSMALDNKQFAGCEDVTPSAKEQAFLKAIAKKAEAFEIPKDSVPEEWVDELKRLPHVMCATQSPHATKNESVVVWLLTSASKDSYKGAIFTTEHALGLVPSKLKEQVPVNVIEDAEFAHLKRVVEDEEKAIVKRSETVSSGLKPMPVKIKSLEQAEVSLGFGKPGAFFTALMAEEIASESGALAVLTGGITVHPLLAPVIGLISLGELAKDSWFWITDTDHGPSSHHDIRLM
eukprot:CAMPEP_0185844860 /NCGR_PEP_ID=MMETSP1354-20130828/961_1 /TAXON_ID=708628 /ORGANISM="Erythrolobus madagascarensis, Strain CCMP3276" /LENGTH=282 /DNA_ID=CAMNT_0028544661 /DNA_START=139 /DNA_END=987 /DNA_ORIENTATION=-